MKRSRGLNSGKSRLIKKRELSPAKQIKEFKIGGAVRIKINSATAALPLKFNNRVGVIQGKQGKAYIVKFKDMNKLKTLVLDRIHLEEVL
jgi:ribosomal protein L21E